MKYYTINKKGEYARVPESLKKRLIDEGKKSEEDFITEDEYIAGDIKAEPKGDSGKPNVENRDIDQKLILIDKLKGLYSGNLQDIVDAVALDKKPTKLNKAQEQLFNLVRTIIKSPDMEYAYSNIAKMKDNRYSAYLNNVIERTALYTDESGAFREPTAKEMFMPNLSERQKAGSGIGSKAIGTFHDITTIPTRALTAGISEFTPYSDNITFGGQMGRTVGQSGPGESIVDFTGSSILPGLGITKGVSATAKLLKGPEKFASVVRDVGSKAVRPALEVIGKSALKGAGEGAAYSLEPSAVLATSPSEEDPWSTFGSGIGYGALGGGALGALGSGARVTGAKASIQNKRFLPEELTASGQERAAYGKSLERLKASIGREDIGNPLDIEKNYANILNETQGNISKKLAGEREQFYKNVKTAQEKGFIPPTRASKPSAPSKPYEPTVEKFDPEYITDDEAATLISPEDINNDIAPDNDMVVEPTTERKLPDNKRLALIKEIKKSAKNVKKGLMPDGSSKLDYIYSPEEAVKAKNALIPQYDNLLYKLENNLDLGYDYRDLLWDRDIRRYIDKNISEQIPEDLTPTSEELNISPVDDIQSTDYSKSEDVILQAPEQNLDVHENIPMNYFRTPIKKQFGAKGTVGRDRLLNEFQMGFPADKEDIIAKEWDRSFGNIESRDFSPESIANEITRLNSVGEKTTDPTLQRIYKDMASKLRDAESQGNLLYDMITPVSDGKTYNVLPEIREKYSNMYETMKAMPSDILKTGRERLNIQTRSEFQKAIEAEKALNALRDEYGMEPADILTAPVERAVRSRGESMPTKGDFEKIARGINEPTPLKVAKGTIPILKAPIKASLKGGPIGTGLSVDEDFNYPPGQVADILVKGGSAPIKLRAPLKKWDSVEDIK